MHAVRQAEDFEPPREEGFGGGSVTVPGVFSFRRTPASLICSICHFPGKLVRLVQNLDCTRGRGQLHLVLPTLSLPVGAAP